MITGSKQVRVTFNSKKFIKELFFITDHQPVFTKNNRRSFLLKLFLITIYITF